MQGKGVPIYENDIFKLGRIKLKIRKVKMIATIRNSETINEEEDATNNN